MFRYRKGQAVSVNVCECGASTCAPCNVLHHTGLTCAQYQQTKRVGEEKAALMRNLGQPWGRERNLGVGVARNGD